MIHTTDPPKVHPQSVVAFLGYVWCVGLHLILSETPCGTVGQHAGVGPSEHGGVTMLDVPSIKTELASLWSLAQEEARKKDPKSNIIPRPRGKITVFGPNGRTLTFGPYRSQMTLLTIVHQYQRRATGVKFDIRPATESEGL